MVMKKIKQGDDVIVLKGKDRGRTGKVITMLDGKALVEGLSLIKKHVKPNPEKQIEGGIIEKESPINLSNLAIINAVTKRPDRVGIKVVDGKKVRYFKSNDELVDI